MATLALVAATAGKTYAAGTMFALTVATSIIDQALLFPAMFPRPTVFGPRIGDYKLQYASEGDPCTRSIGPECRVGVIVKWQSPLKEILDEDAQQGKGGGGGNYVPYKYFQSCFLELSRNRITKLIKLWANGKLVYEEIPSIDYTSGQVSCTRVDTVQTKYGGVEIHHYYQDLQVPAGGIDLSKFKSGKKVLVEGFANAGNNKQSTCVWAKENADGSTTVRLDNQSAVDEAAGPVVHLFQDQPQYSSKLVRSVTVYYGTSDQMPDPVIEGYEGQAEVPAWRGIAGVVLEDLALFDFGNALPQFEALVEQAPAVTVGDAIADIMAERGYIPSQYDVSACTDEYRGFTWQGPVEGTPLLQPTQLAYDLIARVDRGVIVFQPRTSVPVVDVLESDLRAHEPGEEHPPALAWEEPESNKPPRMLIVKHLDPENDYQSGSQAEIAANADSQRTEVVNLDLVLDADQARAIANRILWQTHGNRRAATVTLPPSYLGRVKPGTLMRVTYKGKLHKLLVERVDRGANYRLEVYARVEDQTLSSPVVATEPPLALSIDSGNSGTFHQNPTLTPGFAALHVMDIPPLDDDHLDRPGLYVAGRLTDSRLRFTGALLYESADGGSSWRQREHIAYEAVMGYVSTPPDDVPEGCWDRGSTMTVRMIGGNLSGCTEIECLNGKNRALVGNEVIGFCDAVLVGPDTWEISTLLRGLRGTGEFTGAHLVGERFTLLSGRGIYWLPLNAAAVNQPRLYRLVPNGASLTDAVEEAVTPTARNLMPWPVHAVRGSRDASNNLTITFQRRARSVTRMLAPQAMPIVEHRESYELDVMDGSTVLRTIVASFEGATYTAAQQTTDGLTPGDPVDLNIYQESNLLRRGLVRQATV